VLNIVEESHLLTNTRDTPLLPENPAVAKLEDQIVQATAGKIIEGLPGRNGYGTSGTAIKLRTNSFPISLTPNKVSWYRYLIDITPAPSNQKRRAIITQLIKDKANVLTDKSRATDYATILLLTEKVPDTEVSVLLRQSPSVPVKVDDSAHGVEVAKRNTYNVKITYQAQFALEHLIEWLQSPNASAVYSARTDVIQLINIILCQGPNDFEGIKCIGQNKFYPHDDHPDPEQGPLSGGLQALRGFYASVRPATYRLMLNLNVTAGAFYKPVSLLELWDLHQPPRGGQRSPDQWRQIATFCRHLKFRTTYAKDKQPRDKNFVSFCSKPPYGNANQVKIKWNGPGGTGTERENTVAEFFKQEYSITLKHPQLPVVNVATQKDHSWIPPELAVRVLPGQAYTRLLSGNDTSDMLRFAARAPWENAESLAGTPPNAVGKGLRIFRLVHPSGDMQANSVAKWGFRVETQMITIPGRVLEAPVVNYGAGGKGKIQPRFGAWNSANQIFHTPGTFPKWQVVAVNGCIDGSHKPVVDRFAAHLAGCGMRMGQLGPLARIELNNMWDVRNRDLNDEKIRNSFATAAKNGCGIQLVVLPDQDKWLYARIKYWADVVYGVGTVCCVARKFLKEQGQGMYFGNLALKFVETHLGLEAGMIY
jgi:hypothetical protein